MIHSEHRSLLTDGLTPPPGCQFECGLATTYSLDLVTLLTLPLHLAWMGAATSTGDNVDPLAVLEAVRRTAGRLTVLSERGRLQAPRSASPLLGLLEGMVHEATARHAGAFHPKVWLLQFADPASPTEVKLRLLVLTRNITDDRSWDLALQLDGVVGKVRNVLNRPLVLFFEEVLKMSHKPLTDARRADAERLLANTWRCSWDLPGKFERVVFHPLGVARKPHPWWPEPGKGRWDTLGVASPFIAASALKHLADSADEPLFLISRPESLDAIAEPTPGGYVQVCVLDERAETGDEADDTDGRLSGLHAKVYVGLRGWYTHFFVGSANATEAALSSGRNVEFMVELIGKASKVGQPADLLGTKGLQHLLVPYERTEVEVSVTQTDEDRLEQVRVQLAKASLQLECKVEENGWSVMLTGLGSFDRGTVAVQVWSATQHRDRAVTVAAAPDDAVVVLGVLVAQDITSFTAFRLSLGESELTFALDLPMLNAPEGRDLEVLKAALRNQDGFMRYLMLLLGDWAPWAGGLGGLKRGRSGSGPTDWMDGLPVFEMLAWAFAREPERLEHVRQVIARLRTDAGPADADIVPVGFSVMWLSFERAMKQRVRS